MIKPQHLQRGDTVAIVSLSSGLAGEQEIMHRTQQGISRLKDVFGLNVKIMPHALEGIDALYAHPEWRAEDFNTAVKDPEVKAIICAIGGFESVRILPYIDIDAMKANPKIFSGYSDSTVNHLLYYQHGITSFYGPALLTDFAENNAMDPYTIDAIERTWFRTEPVGNIATSESIQLHGLRWEEANMHTTRPRVENHTYEVINGFGKVQGHLIGGCFELIAMLRGTSLFPDLTSFDGAILFTETSEVIMPEWVLEDNIRSLAVMGILQRLNGVIIGKPQNNQLYEAYKHIWQKVLKEWNLQDMPVLYNASFGHNEPKCILPYGVQAEIDTDAGSFAILESGVR